jgi:hypothetical protein
MIRQKLTSPPFSSTEASAEISALREENTELKQRIQDLEEELKKYRQQPTALKVTKTKPLSELPPLEVCSKWSKILKDAFSTSVSALSKKDRKVVESVASSFLSLHYGAGNVEYFRQPTSMGLGSLCIPKHLEEQFLDAYEDYLDKADDVEIGPSATSSVFSVALSEVRDFDFNDLDDVDLQEDVDDRSSDDDDDDQPLAKRFRSNFKARKATSPTESTSLDHHSNEQSLAQGAQGRKANFTDTRPSKSPIISSLQPQPSRVTRVEDRKNSIASSICSVDSTPAEQQQQQQQQQQPSKNEDDDEINPNDGDFRRKRKRKPMVTTGTYKKIPLVDNPSFAKSTDFVRAGHQCGDCDTRESPHWLKHPLGLPGHLCIKCYKKLKAGDIGAKADDSMALSPAMSHQQVTSSVPPAEGPVQPCPKTAPAYSISLNQSENISQATHLLPTQPLQPPQPTSIPNQNESARNVSASNYTGHVSYQTCFYNYFPTWHIVLKEDEKKLAKRFVLSWLKSKVSDDEYNNAFVDDNGTKRRAIPKFLFQEFVRDMIPFMQERGVSFANSNDVPIAF